MRRLTHIAFAAASVAFAIPLVAVSLSAGTAAAAPVTGTAPAQASASAARPLGALAPTGRVAPKTTATTSGRSTARAVLPAAVNLRKWAVTPGNQGSLNSCVPWTIDYAMLGWYANYTGRVGAPFAPMYTYSQIRRGADGGSYPVDALKLAVAQGSDTRAHYAPGDYNAKTLPTAAERANAARFKVKSFTTLFMGANQPGAIASIKQALATNHPVAVEIAVRSGFFSIGAVASAVDNDVTSKIAGYHEVLAVGYDSAGLIVQSSWGTKWAGDGFGRISWRVAQKDLVEADIIDGFAPAPARR